MGERTSEVVIRARGFSSAKKKTLDNERRITRLGNKPYTWYASLRYMFKKYIYILPNDND